MADLTANDVTITINHKDKTFNRRLNRVTIAFGDAAKTYPANGVPMPALAKFGLYASLDLMNLLPPPGDGYVYKYDKTNHTMRIYQAPVQTHDHDLKVIGGQAATTTNELGFYATSILGKEEATNGTVAGADSATKGGVLSETLAAAALAELGNVAVAATSMEALVYGK